jgi:hypothetical protein
MAETVNTPTVEEVEQLRNDVFKLAKGLEGVGVALFEYADALRLRVDGDGLALYELILDRLEADGRELLRLREERVNAGQQKASA